jgi:CheY-like chemotaxis protein
VGTPYQLLIVEDEPETSAMLREYFDLQGYEVRVATWGKEAIARCVKDPPDLIVLDVGLPDLDGYEVYARLQRHPRAQRIPVIFLTMHKDRDDKIKGLELGATDYVTKPFDLEELSLRVRNALLLEESSHMTARVTDLPTSSEVEEWLRPLIAQDEWAALYLRLQNLGSIDGLGSFPASEEILRAVTDTLDAVLSEYGAAEDFVSHLNETDFVLMTSPARVETLREQIVTRLPRAIRRLGLPRRDKAGGDDATASFLSVGIGLLTSDDLLPD